MRCLDLGSIVLTIFRGYGVLKAHSLSRIT